LLLPLVEVKLYFFNHLKAISMQRQLQTEGSALKQKYMTLYERLAKSVLTGRFAQISTAQQQVRLHRLQRYERQLHRYGIACVSVGALFFTTVPSLSAQTPSGGEFRANTYTTSFQQRAAVATDSDGDFVVVWQSSGQDGNGEGIYGQRYNSSGTAQGSEFRVNTYTTSTQSNPSIAMDSDGDFVVVWQSSGQDGNSDGIYGQRYNSSGTAQGSEFRVNTYTTSNQLNPSIAMDSDGNFIVVWDSSWQDGSLNGIYGQRYNSSGTAQGGEFRVNTYTSNLQSIPSVAMDSDGDFVVVWGSNSQDGSGYGIYGQRYNGSGTAQGSEFRVNTYTTSGQGLATVAMDSDGDFVVVWQSNGQDGSGNGIYGQRYNSSGTAQGSEFWVNTYTTGAQSNPSIAMDSDGDFVVMWNSDGQDGSNNGIYGQRYNSSGTAQGSEFRFNTYTTSIQRYASVAMDSDGDYVVVWQSYGQDGSSYGIYGQSTLVVLPVELVSFSGKNTEGGNLLTWETASEVNNKGFDVERQNPTDGTWQNIGFIAAKSKAATYDFMDNAACREEACLISTYRLRQIDLDGKFNYSKIISIENNGAKGKLIVYPNPVSNALNLNYTEGGDFQIVNLIGQQVLVGATQQQIDVTTLPQGTYFLKVGTEQVKFVKQ
jgi:hypothetical protein